jgi:uncharacterized protein YaaR (DUF327 family)
MIKYKIMLNRKELKMDELDLQKELQEKLDLKGLTLSDDNTIEDFVYYIKLIQEISSYSVDEWIQDTITNYPETFKKRILNVLFKKRTI